MEYTIVPDGNVLGATYPGSDFPYTWASIIIGWGSCVPITGYQIQSRYRVVVPTTTPPVGVPGDPGYTPGETTYAISYPDWELVSQELTCDSHGEGNPFQQENGLFVATPGTYGTAIAGITNNTCYDYFKVFDESESGYIERLSPYDSQPTAAQAPPDEPYDPSADPPLYPIDAMTQFKPDGRRVVNVMYSLTTTYTLGVDTFTDIAVITHPVEQTVINYGDRLKNLIDKSYFAHGITPSMPDDRDPPRPLPEYPNSDGSVVYP